MLMATTDASVRYMKVDCNLPATPRIPPWKMAALMLMATTDASVRYMKVDCHESVSILTMTEVKMKRIITNTRLTINRGWVLNLCPNTPLRMRKITLGTIDETAR